MSDEPVTPAGQQQEAAAQQQEAAAGRSKDCPLPLRTATNFAVTIACHDQHGEPTGKEISDVITAHSADMAHGFALAKHGYTLGTPVTVQEST